LPFSSSTSDTACLLLFCPHSPGTFFTLLPWNYAGLEAYMRRSILALYTHFSYSDLYSIYSYSR
jgi:hypothetical protein